ncbi:cytochrome P450 [Mycobacterium mantenii]|uniref:Cytochrome n=1 Tax=Mycobacterium mantenii TaxID=560555 RepID=A0A1A2T5G0_MYCNT|nr:cytochrome P450 [Mycobacterium mantenii]OBH48979.1 cytochrome [Mycobacterium mantenii]OBH59623.1 cytochrome [Mycobacterium mantenii]OBH65036.1 cytochrome [Mycobacterium mantenii]OBH71546.1 cytochrome [Mycobacterium mantenii]
MSGPEKNLDFFTNMSLVDDPYDYYDAIRRCPVWREPAHGVVMVSGYDEAVAVQRDTDQNLSVCNIVSGPWSGIPISSDSDDISDLIERHRQRITFGDYFITFDPPKHTAHRSLLSRLFTPRQLKNNEDFLWRLAGEQLDRFVADGKCEIVLDYNFPFTLDAITDLLDVPEGDRERFRRAAYASRLEGDRSGFVGVKEEWFVDYIEDRRRNPRDDVLTELALAKFPDGTTPDPIDVARVATFMFAAGHGTTIDLLSLSMLTLAERPDLQKILREDNSMIPAFIEEMLRIESPIKSNFRMARRPTRIGDIDVQAGTSVLVMNGAANRDPGRFEQPDEFRLGRPNILQHMAFGRGIHTCPGAPIARAEVRVSLARMLDRMADIRLSEAEHGPADARRLKWDRTFLFRRLKELHLEFTPIQ